MAVTGDDYEDLAKLASPRVALAKCYGCEDGAGDSLDGTVRPGTVSVVVVPRDAEAQPRPSLELLRRVRDFLSARPLPVSLRAGPHYVSRLRRPRSWRERRPAAAACRSGRERLTHPSGTGASRAVVGDQRVPTSRICMPSWKITADYVSRCAPLEEEEPGTLETSAS
jgi:hypothetical protein